MGHDPEGTDREFLAAAHPPEWEGGPVPVYSFWPRDNPKWVQVFWFQKTEGRTELVGFEMKSAPTSQAEAVGYFDPESEYPTVTPRPLRSSDLDAVRLDTERHRALTIARDIGSLLAHETEVPPLDVAHDAYREVVGEGEAARTPGRPRRFRKEHFEIVAEEYRKAKAGGYRKTNQRVADRMSERMGETVTRKQAERWVYRARHEFHTLGEDE